MAIESDAASVQGVRTSRSGGRSYRVTLRHFVVTEVNPVLARHPAAVWYQIRTRYLILCLSPPNEALLVEDETSRQVSFHGLS